MKNTFKNVPPADNAREKYFNLLEGQIFVPQTLFNDAFSSDPIMQTKILTATEKLCWAKLYQFAGEKGYCEPTLRVLAKSIGISIRQMKRVINGLVDKGFIARKAPDSSQKGKSQATRYSFLWHSCFNDALLREDRPGNE